MGLLNLLSSALLAAPLVLAHPGHHEEVRAHRANPLERKSLNHCKREFNDPEFIRRTVESHGREFARLRREAGLETEDAPKLRPRDYISVSRIDHKSNKPVSEGMDVSTLFADAGACMLMPVVDEGPLCTHPLLRNPYAMRASARTNLEQMSGARRSAGTSARRSRESR